MERGSPHLRQAVSHIPYQISSHAGLSGRIFPPSIAIPRRAFDGHSSRVNERIAWFSEPLKPSCQF